MGQVQSQTSNEDWIQTRWRPMMGWQYMITCTFDFIIFPILFAIIQAVFNGHVTLQWTPITLQGAGLYHISMGAILGVTAWSRGQEKMIDAQIQSALNNIQNGGGGSGGDVVDTPAPAAPDTTK